MIDFKNLAGSRYFAKAVYDIDFKTKQIIKYNLTACSKNDTKKLYA